MHETLWNLGSVGSQALTRHGIPACRHDISASLEKNRRVIKFSGALASGTPKVWKGRAKAQASAWAPIPTCPAAETAALKGITSQSPEGRVSDRCLDFKPGATADRHGIRRPMHSGKCMEYNDQPRLELPEADKTGPRTGRENNCAMGAAHLAAYKKTLKSLAPIWYSLTRAASSWCQTLFAPGRQEAARPNCGVPAGAGARFPLFPPSAFPQSGADWRFMRGFTAERISSLRRLPGFLGIFSSIFAAKWCFSGTPGCRTEERLCGASSSERPGCMLFASRLIPQNLIRLKAYGETLSARWRTVRRKISTISSGLCMRLFNDCGSRRNYCGAAFWPPRYLGHSVSIG